MVSLGLLTPVVFVGSSLRMMSLIDGKLGDQLLALFFVCVYVCV